MSESSARPPVRPVAEGQTFGGESLAVRYVNFVRLPHTVFALPFALLGLLAASRTMAVTPRVVALVVLAFTAARWAAMGFNRIADRAFDARNPRTRNRELPRGVALSPIALAWVLGYSLSKRFTWWPHLWLGLGLAIAPVGGYLAVAGRWSEPAWTLLAIAAAVATWVAGFDIFYALPDEGFDRAEGLRSAVVRLGERRAILLAKLLHGVTVPALALFGWGAGFGAWYYLGVFATALILAYEHRLVRPGDLSRLDAAFFTMNGVMSLTVLAFALVDRLG
ncbi:MAG: UbiA family prenyltransferase [Gemmatimonadetes bacterium]|nr:UbiA family prenyltransferase [Gemmatimonadota bacterium]